MVLTAPTRQPRGSCSQEAASDGFLVRDGHVGSADVKGCASVTRHRQLLGRYVQGQVAKIEPLMSERRVVQSRRERVADRVPQEPDEARGRF